MYREFLAKTINSLYKVLVFRRKYREFCLFNQKYLAESKCHFDSARYWKIRI